VKRREFIVRASGAAVVWPFAALAQTAKIYRVGTLTPAPPSLFYGGS
jgi:putative tryptophan/tyrosine transport system substrate-binding protein